ncbi:hypothetical protein TNCV_1649911 [Trichonephila clavipes]|nr:hypothetical protein TNCV_1649911 [Trichonephila clavipes]
MEWCKCQFLMLEPCADIRVMPCCLKNSYFIGVGEARMLSGKRTVINPTASTPELNGGRGSLVDKVSDCRWPCHEFEPSDTKDPPCWGAMHAKSVESSNVLPKLVPGSHFSIRACSINERLGLEWRQTKKHDAKAMVANLEPCEIGVS